MPEPTQMAELYAGPFDGRRVTVTRDQRDWSGHWTDPDTKDTVRAYYRREPHQIARPRFVYVDPDAAARKK